MKTAGRQMRKIPKNVDRTTKKQYNMCGDNPGLPTGKEIPRMASDIHITGCLADNHGIWTVKARVPDHSGRITQKSKTTGLKVKDHTKRKAEKVMASIIEEWEAEANNSSIHKNPLFRESVELWMQHKRATLRESTVTAYEYNINGHILPALGDLHTKDISLYQIRSFYDGLLKTLSISSVRKIHLIVRGALEDAVDAGIRTDNPAQRVKLKAPSSAKKFEGKAYTADQVSELLKIIEAEEEPIRSGMFLGLCFGLRRSEICGLRWKDIDFEGGTLHVCNTVVENAGQIWELEATKSKKSNRILSLGTYAVPYLLGLRARQQDAGLVLDKVCRWPDGTDVRPSYLSRKQQKILKKHGMEKIRLHDLRHTAGSLLAKKASLKQVQDFLGHADIATTYGIYIHTDDEDRKQTASIMDAVLSRS